MGVQEEKGEGQFCQLDLHSQKWEEEKEEEEEEVSIGVARSVRPKEENCDCGFPFLHSKTGEKFMKY